MFRECKNLSKKRHPLPYFSALTDLAWHRYSPRDNDTKLQKQQMCKIPHMKTKNENYRVNISNAINQNRLPKLIQNPFLLGPGASNVTDPAVNVALLLENIYVRYINFIIPSYVNTQPFLNQNQKVKMRIKVKKKSKIYHY